MNLTLWMTAGRCLTGRQRQTTQPGVWTPERLRRRTHASHDPCSPHLKITCGTALSLPSGLTTSFCSLTVPVPRTSTRCCGR